MTELADVVTYASGYTIHDASFLDPDFVKFIEAEIAAGATYDDAMIAFHVACGER